MERLDAGAPVACSLNDADFRDRRSYARKELIPKITNVLRIKNGLIFYFVTDEQLATDLETFVHLERQCCEFLEFTMLPDPDDHSQVVGLKIEGPPEAAATIEMFAQAALTGVSQ